MVTINNLQEPNNALSNGTIADTLRTPVSLRFTPNNN